jgi:hypothetical protein
MPGRKYIDLTPKELLARQFIVWGLGFSFLPPLLTSCHFGNYLCQTSWHGDVSPLVTLWSLFPWMLPVAVAAVGGLGLVALGAMLLAISDTAVEPLQSVAFQLCAGGLFAILLVGGFGYFIWDAALPGFYRAEAASARNAWLLSQAVFLGVYVTGAALAFIGAWRPLTVNSAVV